MLYRLFTALLLLTSLVATAQFASPISLSTSVEHVEGDRFNLVVKATAEEGWAIYSVYTSDEGPVPTSFTWEEGNHYKLVGKTVEKGHLKDGYDELFGTDVMKFLSDEPVYFTQAVTISRYGEPIQVVMEYMCCDNEQCLPPTEEAFTFNVAPPAPDRGAVPGPADDPSSTTPPTPAPSTAPSTPSTAPAPAPTDPAGTVGAAPDILATYRAEGPAATEDDPVTWAFEADYLGDDEYLVRMTGELEDGWTTYSQSVDPDIGPVPNEFYVSTDDGVITAGDVTEISPTLKEKFDKAWDAVVPKINGGSVTYEQRVLAGDADRIEGYIYYQTCDDEICFPPKEVPFALDLSGATPVASIDGMEAGAASPSVGLGAGAGAWRGWKEQWMVLELGAWC